jgi:cyclopropane fatty-acyl-phospholipid synthase-like methyltransferase
LFHVTPGQFPGLSVKGLIILLTVALAEALGVSVEMTESNSKPSPRGGARRIAPATVRNRAAILEVLTSVLPAQARVLEIASGSGQHAVHFAAALPGVSWQPTDPDPTARTSINAWRDEAALPNLAAAFKLDVCDDAWPEGKVDAVVCINMIHIAAWQAAEALFAGAAAHLETAGVLMLYGPFRIGGAHTAPSNAAFDEDLRARNPLWGVRDLEQVEELGRAVGLRLRQVVPMPANNFTLVFERSQDLP